MGPSSCGAAGASEVGAGRLLTAPGTVHLLTIATATARSIGVEPDDGADAVTRAIDAARQHPELPEAALHDLHAAHAAAHGAQYLRSTLELPSPADVLELDTAERVRLAQERADEGLAALAFHYGRYLLIASSQPGGLPITLQGLWNAELPGPGRARTRSTSTPRWPTGRPRRRTSPSATSRCSRSRGGWPRRPVRPSRASSTAQTAGWRTTIRMPGPSPRRSGPAAGTLPGRTGRWAACGWPCTCGITTRSGSTPRISATRRGRCWRPPPGSPCRGSASRASTASTAPATSPENHYLDDGGGRGRSRLHDDGRRALPWARRGLPWRGARCSASVPPGWKRSRRARGRCPIRRCRSAATSSNGTASDRMPSPSTGMSRT